MLWICIFGSHKMNCNPEKFAYFFAGGGFYYGENFVQKFGLDKQGRNRPGRGASTGNPAWECEKTGEFFEIGG